MKKITIVLIAIMLLTSNGIGVEAKTVATKTETKIKTTGNSTAFYKVIGTTNAKHIKNIIKNITVDEIVITKYNNKKSREYQGYYGIYDDPSLMNDDSIWFINHDGEDNKYVCYISFDENKNPYIEVDYDGNGNAEKIIEVFSIVMMEFYGEEFATNAIDKNYEHLYEIYQGLENGDTDPELNKQGYVNDDLDVIIETDAQKAYDGDDKIWTSIYTKERTDDKEEYEEY